LTGIIFNKYTASSLLHLGACALEVTSLEGKV